MVRLNITVPDDVGKELRRIKNKSRFIAQTLREKFIHERKKHTEKILENAYKKSSKEDTIVAKEWDSTINDGIE